MQNVACVCTAWCQHERSFWCRFKSLHKQVAAVLDFFYEIKSEQNVMMSHGCVYRPHAQRLNSQSKAALYELKFVIVYYISRCNKL